MGGSEGSRGVATNEGARRGLAAGEREGEEGRPGAPWMVATAVVVMLSLREKLRWWWWWWERLLLAVLCDQRLMLAASSRKAPMASAAPLAALERRRAEGGGVARGWGRAGSGGASLGRSEAARWTVTTDDDETDAEREGERRARGSGGTSMVVCGVCQAKPAVNALRRQPWRAASSRAREGRQGGEQAEQSSAQVVSRQSSVVVVAGRAGRAP